MASDNVDRVVFEGKKNVALLYFLVFVVYSLPSTSLTVFDKETGNWGKMTQCLPVRLEMVFCHHYGSLYEIVTPL